MWWENKIIIFEIMIKYPRISKLMVLHSAAGYYVGRLYEYSEDECGPYSRESTYFKTEKAAIKALANNDYVENFN